MSDDEETIFTKLGNALKQPLVIAGIKALAILVGGFLGVGKVFEELDWNAFTAAVSLIILAIGEVVKTVRTQRKIAAAANTSDGLPTQ